MLRLSLRLPVHDPQLHRSRLVRLVPHRQGCWRLGRQMLLLRLQRRRSRKRRGHQDHPLGRPCLPEEGYCHALLAHQLLLHLHDVHCQLGYWSALHHGQPRASQRHRCWCLWPCQKVDVSSPLHLPSSPSSHSELLSRTSCRYIPISLFCHVQIMEIPGNAGAQVMQTSWLSVISNVYQLHNERMHSISLFDFLSAFVLGAASAITFNIVMKLWRSGQP
jgi:hypothetical protein